MKIVNKVIRAAEGQPKVEQIITGVDKSMRPEGSGIILVYNYPLDQKLIIDSLRIALQKNPYFGGRLVGMESLQPRIVANNTGVIYTEILYDSNLPEALKSQPLFTDEQAYFHELDGQRLDEETPVFLIKHTKFLDGSIIGFTVSHIFCDATSLVHFLSIWAKIARSEPIEEFSFDRSILLDAPQEKACASNYGFINKDSDSAQELKHQFVTVQIPDSTLNEIDKRNKITERKIGTKNDILLAFLWKISAQSAKENFSNNDYYPLHLIFNTRKILGIGRTYFGNALTCRSLVRTLEEIIEADIAQTSQWIRKVATSITKQSLLEEAAYWSARWEDKTIYKCKPKPYKNGVAIDNLGSSPIYNIDFSKGGPIWFSTTLKPGNCRHIVACKKQENIHCYLSLPENEVAGLKKFSAENGLLAI